jgi:hypothetical protein
MATAPNVVKFKRSSVAGKIPQTTDLNLGELALNTYDGRIYLKKSVASVETVVAIEQLPDNLRGYTFPATQGTSGQLLVTNGDGTLSWITSAVTSSGTVTSVSVISTNGFAGSVATSTTTPAITISTTVTGLLKGNGTAISAASAGTDYLVYGSLSVGSPNSASGSGSISYSDTTGVFTYTPPDLSSYVTSTSLSSTLGSYVTSSTLSGYNYITLTSLSMDTPGAASGSGSVTYSNTTGKFTYTPPDLSSYITASVATLSSLTSIGSSGVDTTANGNLIVTGNLTVNGTVETINSTTVSVADKNIELGKVATPTDTTANGGGITLKGTTDKTLNWVSATPAWTSSENFDLLTGKTYKINGIDVLSSTTLGSNVVNSSLTSVGTLTNLTVTNTITGSISGNAGTVTNGVYTTGSYANPSWITSLDYSKLTNVPNDNDSMYLTASSLTGYATETYVTTAIASATSPGVRYDISNQNLSKTEQSNARINIGLDDATIYFLSYMFG